MEFRNYILGSRHSRWGGVRRLRQENAVIDLGLLKTEAAKSPVLSGASFDPMHKLGEIHPTRHWLRRQSGPDTAPNGADLRPDSAHKPKAKAGPKAAGSAPAPSGGTKRSRRCDCGPYASVPRRDLYLGALRRPENPAPAPF